MDIILHPLLHVRSCSLKRFLLPQGQCALKVLGTDHPR